MTIDGQAYGGDDCRQSGNSVIHIQMHYVYMYKYQQALSIRSEIRSIANGKNFRW